MIHRWLVVSGGVDCRRRRRNVYDKKPQRYAKDNRTADLTARSDKSVAYVTNNKRLYSTFCTTDRHEASRGLFATTQLLVVTSVTKANQRCSGNVLEQYVHEKFTVPDQIMRHGSRESLIDCSADHTFTGHCRLGCVVLFTG